MISVLIGVLIIVVVLKWLGELSEEYAAAYTRKE